MTEPKPLKVGDFAWVDMPRPWRVMVIEDRGFILQGGRRLLGLALCETGDEPSEDALTFEMPEEDLHRQMPPPRPRRNRPAA